MEFPTFKSASLVLVLKEVCLKQTSNTGEKVSLIRRVVKLGKKQLYRHH
jgi:hypothetical protein